MIAIGADHAGFSLKKEIIKHLEAKGIAYIDYGTKEAMPTDYPIYAKKVSNAILDQTAQKGILICGTGIGISIAANKVRGIRAALCHDTFSARSSREHNDANILALGERVTGVGLALDIVDAFLQTEFSNNERHTNRIKQIEEN